MNVSKDWIPGKNDDLCWCCVFSLLHNKCMLMRPSQLPYDSHTAIVCYCNSICFYWLEHDLTLISQGAGGKCNFLCARECLIPGMVLTICRLWILTLTNPCSIRTNMYWYMSTLIILYQPGPTSPFLRHCTYQKKHYISAIWISIQFSINLCWEHGSIQDSCMVYSPIFIIKINNQMKVNTLQKTNISHIPTGGKGKSSSSKYTHLLVGIPVIVPYRRVYNLQSSMGIHKRNGSRP